MMKPTPVIAALALAITFSAFAFAAPFSAPTTQVMFQGTGTGTFNAKATPFAFSIRCYGTNCVGALSLGEVSDVAYVTGTVTQVQPETYMMSVSSTSPTGRAFPAASPANMSCSLVNTPPIAKGDGNTVTVTCSTPAGSGSSTDATVEVMP